MPARASKAGQPRQLRILLNPGEFMEFSPPAYTGIRFTGNSNSRPALLPGFHFHCYALTFGNGQYVLAGDNPSVCVSTNLTNWMESTNLIGTKLSASHRLLRLA